MKNKDIIPEVGGGIHDFASFMLRMGLYEQFVKRYRDKKIHFVTLEMDENELRRNLLKRFAEKTNV